MKNSGTKKDAFCVKCGTCNTVCPVYMATGSEIYSPRGKQHLKSKTVKENVSTHYAEIFSKCLLCGACQAVCPRGLDTPQLVVNVRSELPRFSGLTFLKYVSRQALMHPALLSGLTRIGTAADTLLGQLLPQDSGLRLRLQGFKTATFKLPAAGYIEKRKAESAAAEEQHKSRPESGISFFTGCLANLLQPEIAESTQLLLAKTTGQQADVPFTQTCCGMASLAAGRIKEARDLAKKNITAFAENDFPILTSCSSCYYHLKSYDELLADEPEWRQRAAQFTDRLQEFSTFFLERFAADIGAFVTAGTVSNIKVFYHDPCHLRFKLRMTEEPRQLIRMLPGVALQELPDGPKCCGQGGLFQVAHPELAQEIKTKLIEEFSALSAQTVVTACSGCLLQWQQELSGENEKRQALHLAIFIARLLQ